MPKIDAINCVGAIIHSINDACNVWLFQYIGSLPNNNVPKYDNGKKLKFADFISICDDGNKAFTTQRKLRTNEVHVPKLILNFPTLSVVSKYIPFVASKTYRHTDRARDREKDPKPSPHIQRFLEYSVFHRRTDLFLNRISHRIWYEYFVVSFFLFRG